MLEINHVGGDYLRISVIVLRFRFLGIVAFVKLHFAKSFFGLSSFLCVIFNSQLFSMLYLLFFRTLPEDIYVKYLDESHAAEKDKIWPYSRPGSEQYLANEIKNNFGIGK